MMIKKRFDEGLQAIKMKILENKQRTGAVFCMLLVILGFFMPFMSVRAGFSVTGVMKNTVEILNPENEMVTISLGDFVLQKPIDAIRIYQTALGDIKLFDQPLLEILRNPLPDKGIISNANEALSSPALDYLVDPRVQEIIATRFERGNEINSILSNSWNVIQSTKNIVGAVNEVSIQARQSMAQINQMMATIDGYKAVANGCVFVLFVIMVGIMALILYKRASINLAMVLSGLMLAFFAAIGMGTMVVNNWLETQLAALVGQLNSSALELIRSVLTGTFGEIGTFIANLIGGQTSFLKMSLAIQTEAGYWVILLGLTGSFVLLLLTRQYDKKQASGDKAVAMLEIAELQESKK